MTNDQQLAGLLPELLREHWNFDVTAAAPLGGGMNSATATVQIDGAQYVAKWVPEQGRAALLAGALAARRIAGGGIRTGEPVPTQQGELIAAATGGAVTLMRWVPGDPMSGDTIGEQRLIAQTLGRAHLVDRAPRPRSEPFFSWLEGPNRGPVEPWVRTAVTQVCAEYRALPPVHWGTLHTDPSPDAFRFDSATGTVGLIDWTGSETGPLLYDIASAVMYLGGPERSQTFLTDYLGTGAITKSELDHLDAFRRFRWVVQAVYFAHRLAMDDRTGIANVAENPKGLDDARRALTALGVVR